MTESEQLEAYKQKMIYKKSMIDWLRGFAGLPSDIGAKELCSKCKNGIVLGQKDDEGNVRYLRSELTGQHITMCGDCQLDLSNRVIESQIAETSRIFYAYEKKVGELGLRYGEKIPTNKKENRGNF